MIIPNEYNCALTSKEGKELFKPRQYSPDFKTRAVRKQDRQENFQFHVLT